MVTIDGCYSSDSCLVSLVVRDSSLVYNRSTEVGSSIASDESDAESGGSIPDAVIGPREGPMVTPTPPVESTAEGVVPSDEDCLARSIAVAVPE